MEATSWMAIKTIRCYQMRTSVYYYGRFQLYVGRLHKLRGEKEKNGGGGGVWGRK